MVLNFFFLHEHTNGNKFFIFLNMTLHLLPYFVGVVKWQHCLDVQAHLSLHWLYCICERYLNFMNWIVFLLRFSKI